MRSRSTLLVAATLLALLGTAGRARAEAAAAEGSPLSPEPQRPERTSGDEAAGLQGARALELYGGGAANATFETRNNNAHWGGALGASVALVPSRLELGAMARFVTGDDGQTLPIDVLLRRPIGISRAVHAYVGGGVAAVLGVGGGARDYALGLASALGANLYVTDTLGVFMQADADLLATRRLTPLFGSSGGLVLGF